MTEEVIVLNRRPDRPKKTLYFPEEDGKQETSPFRGGGNYYQDSEELLAALRTYKKGKR